MDATSLRLHELLIRAAHMALAAWQTWLEERRSKNGTTTVHSQM